MHIIITADPTKLPRRTKLRFRLANELRRIGLRRLVLALRLSGPITPREAETAGFIRTGALKDHH